MTNYISVDDISLKKIKNKNVLFLADTDNKTYCVSEYIKEIKKNSKHKIQIVNPRKVPSIPLANIEVIIIHYSIYISSYNYLSKNWQNKIQKFKKLKLLIIQDEYRHVDLTSYQINKLGFGYIISSLSISNLKIIYPESKFKKVTFISSLPGYVSSNMLSFFKSHKIRTCDIFGRGSELPLSLGLATIEKDLIYIKLRKKIIDGINLNFFKKIISGVPLIINKNKYKIDISSSYDDRLYNDKWMKKLSKTKCVLGVEGGSSIFDFDSSVQYLNEKLKVDKSNSVKSSNIYLDHFSKYNNIHHRTITPRIFEAICSGTILLLLEGEYRNALKPYVHYIPIKKDLSNIWNVLKLTLNKNYTSRMRKKSFDEVAMNKKYHFKYFTNKLDMIISS